MSTPKVLAAAAVIVFCSPFALAQTESRNPEIGTANERGVAERVAFILMRSTQIAETKKRPDRDLAPSMRRLESVWIEEINGLEAYCLKKFGKSVSLAPAPTADTANAAKAADGEAGVPPDQIAAYRIFYHKTVFVKDKLLNVAMPQCK